MPHLKAINIVEPVIKENNSYTFNDKEISDILRKTHFDKKASNFENSHKEATAREVDKLLAEKPKNCKSAIKDLNSYSAPGQDRLGTLLIKNGGDYLHKTITDILNANCQQGFPQVLRTWGAAPLGWGSSKFDGGDWGLSQYTYGSMGA